MVIEEIDFRILICLWVLMGTLTAWLASKKGRRPRVWFFIGVFFGLLALAILVFMPKIVDAGDVDIKENPQENSKENSLPLEPEICDPQLSSKEWHYIDGDHQKCDPVNFKSLKKLWDEGIVTEETFLWMDDMKDWEKCKKLPGLQKLLHEEPPPTTH